MDVDLPVWTIRPNWSGGVLERLEWLTDVIASDTGVEQRQAKRLSPRRSFEFTVNPTRAERTYLDLILHRLGSEQWLLPLWHDQAVLGANSGIDTEVIEIDNTFREFTSGGYAILYRDAFTWEVVQITDQTAGTLELAGGPEKSWPRGTKVYPLRQCYIQTETTLKAITSRVGESVLLFQVNEANDYAEAIGDEMVIYAGSPLLTREPDRSREITTDHTRLFDQQDGEVGLVYRTDRVGRAFAVQSHSWQIVGREAHAGFRSFLYTLRGRQRMVWLPTFNDDIILSRPAAPGNAAASFEKVGLRYAGSGGPIPGRSTLWTGSEVLNIGTVLAGLTPDEERATFVTPRTGTYAPGASWSFLQPARLDQDNIELHHHTDSDGVMEVAAGFHTFANTRDGLGSNFVPITPSLMTAGTCGVPLGSNPCAPGAPPFEPYAYISWGYNNKCNQMYARPAPIFFHIPEITVNPGGKKLTEIGIPSADGVFYLKEYDLRYVDGVFQPDYGGPLKGQTLVTYLNQDKYNGSIKLHFAPNPGEFGILWGWGVGFCDNQAEASVTITMCSVNEPGQDCLPATVVDNQSIYHPPGPKSWNT